MLIELILSMKPKEMEVHTLVAPPGFASTDVGRVAITLPGATYRFWGVNHPAVRWCWKHVSSKVGLAIDRSNMIYLTPIVVWL